VTCLNLEFSQRVWWRTHNIAGAVQKINEVCVVVDAVQNEVILFPTLAVGNKITRASAARISEGWIDSGSQLRDKYPVTPVERCFVERFGVDNLANGPFLRLQQRYLISDRYRLRHSTGFQDKNDIQPLLQVQVQVLSGCRRESGRGCADLVVADLDWGKDVDTTAIRLVLQYQTCISVGQCDLYARYDGVGGVLHNSGNGPLINLCACHTAYEEYPPDEKRHTNRKRLAYLPQISAVSSHTKTFSLAFMQ